MNKLSTTTISILFGLLFLPILTQAQSFVTSVNSTSGETIKVGSQQTVEWKTTNFPINGKVNINLIHKVSDSPTSYELVRQLSVSTANDGSEVWVPQKSEVGKNLMIEVTCSDPKAFKDGCGAKNDNQEFAIQGGFGTNLANVFEAIVEFFSRIFE